MPLLMASIAQVCHHISFPFQTLAGSCGKFAPFEIKENMVLAPFCRTTFDQDLCDQLDQLMQQQSGDLSFLKDLKGRRPLRSGPTVVSNRNADIFNRLVPEKTVLCSLVKSEHSWQNSGFWFTAEPLWPGPVVSFPGLRPSFSALSHLSPGFL